MAVKRINAYFTGVTETDDGDFLAADSVAVISAVDEDDQYTEVLRLRPATSSPPRSSRSTAPNTTSYSTGSWTS